MGCCHWARRQWQPAPQTACDSTRSSTAPHPPEVLRTEALTKGSEPGGRLQSMIYGARIGRPLGRKMSGNQRANDTVCDSPRLRDSTNAPKFSCVENGPVRGQGQ